jgi:hypothetical protein
MEILAKPRDGMNGNISDIAALGKDQVTEPGSYINDLLHSSIGKART